MVVREARNYWTGPKSCRHWKPSLSFRCQAWVGRKKYPLEGTPGMPYMLSGGQGRQPGLQVRWDMVAVGPAELTVIWSSFLLRDIVESPPTPGPYINLHAVCGEGKSEGSKPHSTQLLCTGQPRSLTSYPRGHHEVRAHLILAKDFFSLKGLWVSFTPRPKPPLLKVLHPSWAP